MAQEPQSLAELNLASQVEQADIVHWFRHVQVQPELELPETEDAWLLQSELDAQLW